VQLPETASPAKVTIAVEAVAGGKKIDNDWSAMLYPAVIRPEKSPVPIFATESLAKPLPNWGVQPISAEGDLGDRAVYLVDSIHDARVMNALERGAAVVVLNDKKPLLTARQVTMSTSWWKGTHPGQTNHTGTLVYDHPVTRAMAPAGWCDEGWFHLIHGAWKFNLEAASSRPEVIIRALPTFEPVEDEAVVFEVGVGKGCLIVSGLNHQQAAGRPENDWFLARLVDHAATLPHPKTTWPVSFVSQEK
jgi:hypothetical protein